MRKIFFCLSLLGHVLVIAFLARVRFPITIAPAAPVVIAISLAQPGPVLQAPMDASGSRGRANQAPGPASLSACGSGAGGATPVPPGSTGQPLTGSGRTGPALFPANAKLRLRAWPRSAFSLVLPVSGPAIVAASFPGTGKWGPAGKPTAVLHPGGVYFGTTTVPPGGRQSRLPFAARDKEAAAWNRDVLARIERNWVIPTVARVGWTGQVEITLTIDRGGSLLSLVVERSSSREALDQAALNAMKASLPFPPLPESLDARPFVFHFIFTYNA